MGLYYRTGDYEPISWQRPAQLACTRYASGRHTSFETSVMVRGIGLLGVLGLDFECLL
jgi:hypothetical protein